jgi:hypothetical protein
MAVLAQAQKTIKQSLAVFAGIQSVAVKQLTTYSQGSKHVLIESS